MPQLLCDQLAALKVTKTFAKVYVYVSAIVTTILLADELTSSNKGSDTTSRLGAIGIFVTAVFRLITYHKKFSVIAKTGILTAFILAIICAERASNRGYLITAYMSVSVLAFRFMGDSVFEIVSLAVTYSSLTYPNQRGFHFMGRRTILWMFIATATLLGVVYRRMLVRIVELCHVQLILKSKVKAEVRIAIRF